MEHIVSTSVVWLRGVLVLKPFFILNILIMPNFKEKDFSDLIYVGLKFLCKDMCWLVERHIMDHVIKGPYASQFSISYLKTTIRHVMQS